MTSDYTRPCPFCEGTGCSGKCTTCAGGGYTLANGLLTMCTDCMGSGEAYCPYCSSNSMVKLGY